MSLENKVDNLFQPPPKEGNRRHRLGEDVASTVPNLPMSEYEIGGNIDRTSYQDQVLSEETGGLSTTRALLTSFKKFFTHLAPDSGASPKNTFTVPTQLPKVYHYISERPTTTTGSDIPTLNDT